MSAPVEARRDGRRVRLKWHQLRRRREDPPFDRDNLRAGLAAGASLEVDVRALACGRFVCLHDADLESETTGRGAVAASDAQAVARLRMRGGGTAPLLLEELAAIVRAGPVHPAARVQLDLYGEVGPEAERAFASALEGLGPAFILGGHHWERIARLGARVPGLALGWDPSDRAREVADLAALVARVAPGADTIYLHRGIVCAAASRGEPLVARLRERGHRVDCWTLDLGRPGAEADFAAALAAGCDEVTTNTPAAWAEARG